MEEVEVVEADVAGEEVCEGTMLSWEGEGMGRKVGGGRGEGAWRVVGGEGGGAGEEGCESGVGVVGVVEEEAEE